VGLKDIEAGTVNFADSEVPATAADIAKVPASAGGLLQVPVDLGGVALSYNIPGVRNGLHLSTSVLTGIFDGSITNWDNSQIAKSSGDSKLPNLKIVPVHRADSSGPGYDLDQYLIDTSPTWVSKVGTKTPSLTWPLASVGLGEQLNSGVADYIHETRGAIGYVSYGYAVQDGFTNAALPNQDGNYVAPSTSSIAAAGSKASNLSATNFSIIYESGANTYPLANFSWTLLDRKQSDATTEADLAQLFNYVIATGQSAATSLGYVPLPADALALAKNTLGELEG
jgi:phosphate transport system substrate-binding protein